MISSPTFRHVGAALAATTALASPQLVHAQASPSSFTTGYRYDTEQRLVGTVLPDPDGVGALKFAATRNSYDVNGRLTKVETGELAAWPGDAAPSTWTGFTVFRTIDYAYDDDGRRTREVLTGSDAVVKSVTQTSYDALDRTVCVAVRMDPAQWSGQPDACAPQTNGPNGPDRITKTLYLATGQVDRIQKAFGTSLQQNYATYTYWSTGATASITDANQNRAGYSYNNLGRLERWYFPSKTTANTASTTDFEEYGYDLSGNRTSRRNRMGYWFTYTFDALNRNTSKIVPDDAGWLDTGRTRDVYYGYDNRDLMTYARFDSASGQGINNQFDNLGRLSSMTNSMIGAGKTLSYLYDADSNRTQVTQPDGIHSDWVYDGLDRASQAFWNMAGGNYPFASYSYNSQGLRSGRGEATSWTSYNYDAAARLSTTTHGFAASTDNLTQTFGYNPASQITTQTSDSDAFAFTGYYPVNRNYAVNGQNQYTAAGPANFSYDGNGNLTGDGTYNYIYDMENRLVYATGPTATSLYYDPLGRLWAAITSTSDRRLLYDGDNLVGEFNSGGDMLKRYFFGPGVDEPLVEDDSSFNCGNTRFLHADNRGSIIARADCSGNLTTRLTYDEWGIPASTNPSRFGYTGQVWMPEIGMYYYKARMYSPTIGRFMQTDPIGYKDQMNLYAYVGNDPVDGTDPTGLWDCRKGSETQCNVTAAALRLARDALRGMTGSDASRERTALAAWGSRGDGNGVVVKAGPIADVARTSTSGGITTVTINSGIRTLEGLRMASLGSAAGTISHEGQHIVDERQLLGGRDPRTQQERYDTERRAYGLQGAVDRALGAVSQGAPKYWIWGPGWSRGRMEQGARENAWYTVCKGGRDCSGVDPW